MIAIVDDEQVMRKALEAFIESLGHAAAAFASAEEYLRSGFVKNTSCLISDMRMPGMNGLRLQRHLIAEGHRVPTIFLTAEDNDELRASGLKEGAIAFLLKPVAPRTLLECIEDALQAS